MTSNIRQFSREIDAFNDKEVPAAVKALKIDFVEEAMSMLLTRSPVDTGLFRGNWRAAIGGVNESISDTLDTTGGVTLHRAMTIVRQIKPGDDVYIANSLPYAQRLEYGWSNQAPSGIVRVTANDLRRRFK